MELNKELLKNFSQSESDLKGEIVACEFVNNGVSSEDIYLKNLGIFNRSKGKDIQALKYEVKDEQIRHLTLELNREGLYDMLPEELFHYRGEKDKALSKNSILQKIKEVREEESFARCFFGPFENEFLQMRLMLEINKQSILKPESVKNNRTLFESIFGDSSMLKDTQLLALLYILPMSHKIRGDVNKISICLQAVLHHKTQIRILKNNNLENCEIPLKKMGEARLGVDSIAGNCFLSLEPIYEILVFQVRESEIPTFFPNGSNFLVIKFLTNFLFTLLSKYHLKIQVQENERFTTLSNDKRCNYLGFNTYL